MAPDAPDLGPPLTARERIVASNRARKGIPRSPAARANIAAANRLRARSVDGLAGWKPLLDFSEIDEPMIAMRRAGLPWKVVGSKIGVSHDICCKRMRALAAADPALADLLRYATGHGRRTERPDMRAAGERGFTFA